MQCSKNDLPCLTVGKEYEDIQFGCLVSHFTGLMKFNSQFIGPPTQAEQQREQEALLQEKENPFPGSGASQKDKDEWFAKQLNHIFHKKTT